MALLFIFFSNSILKQIPIVTIDKDLENRMASTIRHNRARGTHQIIDMSNIVLTLTGNGWTEAEISKHLGMELDEVIRLKQITGLKESFSNHKFSKSWEEYEENIVMPKIHNELLEAKEIKS